jgi:hypothetical protein
MGADSSKDSGDKPWDMPSISSLPNSLFEPNVPSVRLDPRVVENAFSQELDPATADLNVGKPTAVEHHNTVEYEYHLVIAFSILIRTYSYTDDENIVRKINAERTTSTEPGCLSH